MPAPYSSHFIQTNKDYSIDEYFDWNGLLFLQVVTESVCRNLYIHTYFEFYIVGGTIYSPLDLPISKKIAKLDFENTPLSW